MKRLAITIQLLVINYLLTAQIPETMSFQGFLRDANGDPANETVDMEFKLFDDASVGTEFWTEAQTGVVVSNGIYNVNLGGTNNLGSVPFDRSYWLEVTIDSEVLSPRIKLNTSAYAFGTSSLRSDIHVIDPSGNVGFGTIAPQRNLHVRTSNNAVLRLEDDNGIWDFNAGQDFFIHNPSGEEVLTIFGSDNRVKIGSTAPSANLLVNGFVGVGTDSPGKQLHLVSESNGADIIMEEFNNAQRPSLTMRRANGSLAAPAPVGVDQNLGALFFSGWDGDSWPTGALVIASASEDFGTSAGSRLEFFTDEAGDATKELKSRMLLSDKGFLGLGTSGPESLLHIEQEGDDADLKLRQYANSNSAEIFLERALGTIGSPTSPTNGDVLGSINFNGLTNSGMGLGASIFSKASIDFSGGISAADIQFLTTGIGGGQSTRMTIGADGEVTISALTSVTDLQTDGNGTLINAVSDPRLKNILRKNTLGLDFVSELGKMTIQFQYKENEFKNRLGWNAAEVMDKFPEFTGFYKRPNDDYWLWDSKDFLAPLYKGVSQLSDNVDSYVKRIEALEEENARLKEANSSLETRLEALSESVNKIERTLRNDETLSNPDNLK